jgi:multiple sugar transport system permease protein
MAAGGRFTNHIFRRWMANSLPYSLSATAITLVTAVPVGYGLAVGRFPGRRLILSLTLVALIIPSAALVLLIFLELNALRLIGSRFSIILPFAFFPFGVYLAYIYYTTALPSTLLDAARVDGCGEWAAFRHVGIPLAKPSVALVFFFAFVANWNNFFLPYVFLSDERMQPIQVGLSDIFSSSRPALALATLVAAMRVAVVFVVSQRELLRGLVGGSTKGLNRQRVGQERSVGDDGSQWSGIEVWG